MAFIQPTTSIDLRGQQERLRVAQQNADNEQRTVKLVEATYTAGRGTEIDTARARALNESTASHIPAILSAIAQAGRGLPHREGTGRQERDIDRVSGGDGPVAHNYSFGNILAIARQRAVTQCCTSRETINTGVRASLETQAGRLVAVRTNFIGLTDQQSTCD